MACFLVILLFVQGELGYDNFHEKGDRIHRMVLDRLYPGRHTEYAAIPHSYAISAKLEYPEIEESCRIFKFPGTILLKKGEEILRERDCTLLWFNARIIAVSFYKNLGYKTIGPEFDIPLIGPHYLMKKELE